MKDVVSSGTGTMARLSTTMAVAGKTGTTSNDFDHWFVGYTPYYTAGIWCGYDSNRTFLTGSVEKKLWAKIMNEVISYKEYEPRDFDACDDIVTSSICRKCGKLAVNELCSQDPRGSMVRTEYFATGTAPTEKCDCHTKVTICLESGLPATEFCPLTQSKVYISRPKDSTGTTADTPYVLPSEFADTTCDVHTDESTVVLPEDAPDKVDEE
jgi:penicillin-binding protein 1A